MKNSYSPTDLRFNKTIIHDPNFKTSDWVRSTAVWRVTTPTPQNHRVHHYQTSIAMCFHQERTKSLTSLPVSVSKATFCFAHIKSFDGGMWQNLGTKCWQRTHAIYRDGRVEHEAVGSWALLPPLALRQKEQKMFVVRCSCRSEQYFALKMG